MASPIDKFILTQTKNNRGHNPGPIRWGWTAAWESNFRETLGYEDIWGDGFYVNITCSELQGSRLKTGDCLFSCEMDIWHQMPSIAVKNSFLCPRKPPS